MKSILFVINTLGGGGGEKAMIELLKRLDMEKYEISLFVLMGQGELITKIPKGVKLLNRKYYPISVLDNKGKIRLFRTLLEAMATEGTFFLRLGYMIRNLIDMIRDGKIRKEKLLWKILSDGAPKFEQKYDMAVAYLEGGASYYVASHVKARKKVAFIHTNYKLAGYCRKLDEDCYLNFDHVFTVSENVKNVFLSVYPECREKTSIFYNLIDRNIIEQKAKEAGGFKDDFEGFRILTVGRLVPEKAHDIEIETMRILKESGKSFRWYVLGEGNTRRKLEKKIRNMGLEKDFVLLGTVDNPFPYYVQCDLYVHASYLEGKSIAIEEAQLLGCAIVASDHEGIYEQIEDGIDGEVCNLCPEELAIKILRLVNNPKRLEEYAYRTSRKKLVDNDQEIKKFVELLSEN